MKDNYDVCDNCGRKRNEKIEPHCKDCGHDHTTSKKDFDKTRASRAKNVCEKCGYGWPDDNQPGCKECGHDMSIKRELFNKTASEKEELGVPEKRNIDKKRVAKSALLGAIGLPTFATGTTAALDKMDGKSFRHSLKDTAKGIKNNKADRMSILSGAAIGATAAGLGNIVKQKREKTASELMGKDFRVKMKNKMDRYTKEFCYQAKNNTFKRPTDEQLGMVPKIATAIVEECFDKFAIIR